MKIFNRIAFLFVVLIATACIDSGTNSALKEEVIQIESDRVIQQANIYLSEIPITVTDAFCERSTGGIHDFYSEGDYWWPNPKDPSGPFIRKDGLSNPGNFLAHRKAMRRLSYMVPTLVSAYLITEDSKYAEKAIEHALAWFVNSDTRMSPNLLYSQAIQGRYTGRGIGIIDTIHLVEVVQALLKLQEAGLLNEKNLAGLQNWFDEYLKWLTTHEYGEKEKNNGNNHSTCWAMQVAMFAKFTNNKKLVTECQQFYKEVLLPDQMSADGSFPKEMARTKPYGYALFNMDAMTALCQIASTKDDNLWEFTTPDGKNIKQSVDFMFPFVVDKSSWKLPKDVMYFDDWPMRHSTFLFANIAFDDNKYFVLWKRLPPESDKDEIMRNFFIRQPMLWID